MSIIKRVQQIVAANINDLLDKAEDPELKLAQLIREMEEHVVEARLETAKAISAEKKLARRVNGERETLKKWEEKSETAVQKGDDEAARRAIAAKIEAKETLQELRARHEQAERAGTALKEQLCRLEEKVREAKKRKDILVTRKRQAEGEKAALDAAEKFRRTSATADAAMESDLLGGSVNSLEDAVTGVETEVEARRELEDATRSADERLDDEARRDAVEKELERMKEKQRE